MEQQNSATHSRTVNSIKVTTSAHREAPEPMNVSLVRMSSSSGLHWDGDGTQSCRKEETKKITKNIRVSHVKHSRCHSEAKYQKMLKCFNSFTTYEHMLQNYKHNVSDLSTLWLTPCG